MALTPTTGHEKTRLARPVHSRAFRLRRSQNWLVLGFTYAAMYMARYNFAFANKSLSDTYGWDKAQVGSIITFSTLVYGLSAMFNGPIADRWGGRKAMIVGATGACVFNFAFGLGAYLGVLGTGSVLLGYLATIWTLNMYFQSYSALALIKVNAGWFHVSERGVFSAIFGSMIQSGRAAVYGLMSLGVVVALPWQWKFFLPAAIVAVFTVLTIVFVRDLPTQAGLPEFDTEDATSGDTEKVTFRYLARKIFTNPVTITIACAEFCTGLVRKGFEEWFPRYMQEVQHLQLDNPVFQRNALFIVGAGIAGAFAAGTLSDWVFRSRRPPVAFIGYVLQVASLAVVWRAPSLTLVIVAFVVNSFAISMVHSMLSGTASMDFGGKRAAASAAGMFDGMQYVGGSVMGWGMGALLDKYGWGVWGPSMIGFSAVGAVLMTFLWNVTPSAAWHAHERRGTVKRTTWETLRGLVPAVLGGSVLSVLGLVVVRACVPAAALEASNDVIGNYLQTLGGIYAVLLAFVVVIVWQQFNDARLNVESEANEIADLFRTSQGMPAAQRARMADCLSRYVDSVLEKDWPAMVVNDEAALERVGHILDEISEVLHSFEPGSTCHQSLHAEALARFNDLSDARSMRLSSSRARIPSALRWLLYTGALILVGSTWLFAVDSFVIHAIVTGALAAGVSHVIYVIEDLDDSFGGAWQVPREPFERVRAHMRHAVSAARDGRATA